MAPHNITIKPGNKKTERKSPEERHIESMFTDETSDEVELNIHAEAEDNSFEHMDYGLTEESSYALWKRYGEELTAIFHNDTIMVLAALDSFKSVEDHIREMNISSAVILDQTLLQEITTLLHLRYLAVLAEKLNLPQEIAEKFLEKKLVVKQLFADILNQGRESNPYGATPVSMSARKSE